MAISLTPTAPVINPLTGQPYIIPGITGPGVLQPVTQPVTQPNTSQPPATSQPSVPPPGTPGYWGTPGPITIGGVTYPYLPPGGHTELPPGFYGGGGGSSGGTTSPVRPTELPVSPTVATTGPMVNQVASTGAQIPAQAYGQSIPVSEIIGAGGVWTMKDTKGKYPERDRYMTLQQLREQYPERFYRTEGSGTTFERFYTGPMTYAATATGVSPLAKTINNVYQPLADYAKANPVTPQGPSTGQQLYEQMTPLERGGLLFVTMGFGRGGETGSGLVETVTGALTGSANRINEAQYRTAEQLNTAITGPPRTLQEQVTAAPQEMWEFATQTGVGQYMMFKGLGTAVGGVSALSKFTGTTINVGLGAYGAATALGIASTNIIPKVKTDPQGAYVETVKLVASSIPAIAGYGSGFVAGRTATAEYMLKTGIKPSTFGENFWPTINPKNLGERAFQKVLGNEYEPPVKVFPAEVLPGPGGSPPAERFVKSHGTPASDVELFKAQQDTTTGKYNVVSSTAEWWWNKGSVKSGTDPFNPGIWTTPNTMANVNYLRVVPGPDVVPQTEIRWLPWGNRPKILEFQVSDITRAPKSVRSSGWRYRLWAERQPASDTAVISGKRELAGGNRNAELEALILPNKNLKYSLNTEGLTTAQKIFGGYKKYTVLGGRVIPIKKYNLIVEGAGGKLDTSRPMTVDTYDTSSGKPVLVSSTKPSSMSSMSERVETSRNFMRTITNQLKDEPKSFREWGMAEANKFNAKILTGKEPAGKPFTSENIAKESGRGSMLEGVNPTSPRAFISSALRVSSSGTSTSSPQSVSRQSFTSSRTTSQSITVSRVPSSPPPSTTASSFRIDTTPSRPPPSTPPWTPYSRIITPPSTPPWSPSSSSDDSGDFGGLFRRRKGKQKRKYVPSRVSFEFGITAPSQPKPRGGFFTGLEVLPIVGKWKRPRLF